VVADLLFVVLLAGWLAARPGRLHAIFRWFPHRVSRFLAEGSEVLSGAITGALHAATAAQRQIVHNAMGFTGKTVGALMVPRPDMVCVAADTPVAQVFRTFGTSAHNRIPVHEGDLDKIIGFLHAKDLMRVAGGPLEGLVARDLIRPILAVPVNKPVHQMIHEFQTTRTHLAIVLDEFGGTAGMVTINDLLEQLAGEVHDELRPGLPDLARDGDGAWFVRGLVSIVEVNQRLGLDLPCEDYNTLAGLVFGVLGRTPEPGDEVQLSPDDRVRCRVLATNGRRATLLRLASPQA
jgi:putative hemolysin